MSASLSVDRWSLLRLLRILLPVAVLALAGGILAATLRGAWGEPCPWSEAAFADTGVGGGLLESRRYELGTPGGMCAHGGALWHLLLWGGGAVWGSADRAGAVLSLLCAAGALVACSRMARDLFSGNIFVWGVLISLAVSPAFLDALVCRSSLSLLFLLLLMAVKRHLDGMRGHTPVLSPVVALYTGLAGLVDPGAALLYPVLALHAALLAPRDPRRTTTGALLGVRFALGLVLILLILWPVADLNVRALHQLLPRPPTAETGAWVAWLGVGRLQILPMLLALLALAALRLRPVRDPLVSLLLILLPAAWIMGPLADRMGWMGMAPLRMAAEPLLLLVLVWLLTALARARITASAARNVAGVAVVAAAFLLCVFFSVRIQARTLRDSTASAESFRKAVAVRPPSDGLLVATDLPGAAHRAGYRQLLDLTGRTTPEVLRCVDSSGSVNLAEIMDYFRARQPDLLLLRSSALHGLQPLLEKELGAANVTTTVVDHPDYKLQVLAVKWPR